MLETFIFVRAEGWYPVEIPAADLHENIHLKPGTVRVEDIQGNTLWSADARPEGKPAASPLGGPPSGLEAGCRPPVSPKGGVFDRPDGPLTSSELQALAFLRDEPHTLDKNDENAFAAMIVFRDLEQLGLVAMDADGGDLVVTLLPAGRSALAQDGDRGGVDAT